MPEQPRHQVGVARGTAVLARGAARAQRSFGGEHALERNEDLVQPQLGVELVVGVAHRGHRRIGMARGGLAGHNPDAGRGDRDDEPAEVLALGRAAGRAGDEDLVGERRGGVHPHLSRDDKAVVALAHHPDGRPVGLGLAEAKADRRPAGREGQEASCPRQLIAVGRGMGDLGGGKTHRLQRVQQAQRNQRAIARGVGDIAPR